MSLKWYVRPRLVILNSKASVIEAARALEHNNIGVVLVQDKGQAVGIVTDRDIAVRAVGHGRDPSNTPLSEVMTAPVATLSPANDQSDAIKLMQDRNIRRVPLVENGRLVGIVTLDDLLLDEAAPLEELAAIVQAQIGEGGPQTSMRAPAQARRVARAEATYRRMLNAVRMEAGLDDVQQAESALEIVAASAVRRLTQDEAKDLIAQLPSLLHPKLQPHRSGPDKSITRETIETALSEALNLNPERISQVLRGVGTVITRSVSAGQMEEVRNQLPQGLREVFDEPPASIDHAG